MKKITIEKKEFEEVEQEFYDQKLEELHITDSDAMAIGLFGQWLSEQGIELVEITQE